MTVEQQFVKCLYLAYKKGVKLFISPFETFGNDNFEPEEYDNSFWSNLDDIEATDIIEHDPRISYYNLNSYIDDDYKHFYFGLSNGRMQLCTKLKDFEFNDDGICSFLKEYEGTL